MALRLRAEYINGTLEPLELQDGTVVTLYIEEQIQNKEQQQSVLETADRIRQSAPAEIWDNLPADRAQNFKLYLYGHSKEDS